MMARFPKWALERDSGEMDNAGKIISIEDDRELDDAVAFIVANVPQAQLVEMYYWIQEGDLLRIIRALAGAPQETREALAAFLGDVRPSETGVSSFADDSEFTLRKQRKIQFALQH